MSTIRRRGGKHGQLVNDSFMNRVNFDSLRSSNKNLLIVPDIRSEMGRRSFYFASPSIWNSLPQQSTYPLFRFIIGFPWSTEDLVISKVSSTIVINSLHNVSSDFDLRTWTPLFHAYPTSLHSGKIT